jgi:hypothetical protein
MTNIKSSHEQVLGFTVSSQDAAMVGFETGAFRLYVEAGQPHGPAFDFLAADVAAAKAQLMAAGCTLVEEDPSIPRCYLRDPFGVVFNVGRTATCCALRPPGL